MTLLRLECFDLERLDTSSKANLKNNQFKRVQQISCSFPHSNQLSFSQVSFPWSRFNQSDILSTCKLKERSSFPRWQRHFPVAMLTRIVLFAQLTGWNMSNLWFKNIRHKSDNFAFCSASEVAQSTGSYSLLSLCISGQLRWLGVNECVCMCVFVCVVPYDGL